ncbi:PQQ-binding-like beta-propeller repeat protein [candidate division KSB1 bacterium]|nr:PQQ-binding-like beta-propeller repeat protein [candidate division KSB1 bacterium]
MVIQRIRKMMILLILVSTFGLYAQGELINDDSGTENQVYPAIAMTASGMSVMCWEDNRNGNSNIYAQLFNRAGLPQGVNFRVHAASDSTQASANVAINQFGHMTFVWDDKRDGHYDIYARMFEPNGQAKHAAFRVNDDAGVMSQRYPKIAMNAQGDYVVCWLDTRADSLPEVAFQLFASNGVRCGSNVIDVSDPDELCFWPDAAMADNGDFVITWLQQDESGYMNLYAALFDTTGQEVEPPFKVNSHPSQDASILWQHVAMQPDGSFMTVWMFGYDGGFPQVFGKCFDAQGGIVRDQFFVNSTEVWGARYYPDITAIPDSSYMVVWSMNETDMNVYAREFDTEGQPVDLPVLVTDDAGGQLFPAVAADGRGIAVCIWQDNRDGDFDIYGEYLGPRMPMDVQAGSWFNNHVPIAWNPIYGDTEHRTYYIYRGTDPTGYFDLVATVNTADRPYPALMHDWIDTDVTPGETYYYKMDCDNPDITKRSETVSARVGSWPVDVGGFWSQNKPTIDGLVEEDEWADCPAFVIGYQYHEKPVIAHVKNDLYTLYFGVQDLNDTTLNNTNAFGMLFDEDNDNTWDPSGFIGEGRFDVVPSGAYFTPFYGDYPNIGLGAMIGAEGVESAITLTNGYVQYEIAIDLEESALQALPGETIGMAFWIKDPGNLYSTYYGNAGEIPREALWDAALPLMDYRLASEPDTTTNLSWPMLDGGPKRNRWAEDENQLAPPFEYDTTITPWDNQVDFSVHGSTLIAGVGGDPITIYGYDLDQDSVLWSFEIPGSGGALSCQPAVNDSLVLCGGQGGDGLYALDRWTGAVRWMRPFGSLHVKHPILEGEYVYICDDSLYCLDQKDGSTVWSSRNSGFSSQKTPAVDGRNTYWVIDDSVLCLDKRDGESKWRVSNPGHDNSIAIDDDYIYVLREDSLMARRIGDGSRRWSAYIENNGLISWSGNNLAVSDSVVCLSIIGNNEQPGELLTFNRLSGDLLWQHVFDTLRVDRPFIVNGNVYTINRSDLYGFDAWSGTQTYYYESHFTSDVAVANHAIYLSDWQGIRVLANENPQSGVSPSIQTHGFKLYSNYPNPFNPVTQIHFDVGRQSHVRLTVYNSLGQEVTRLVDTIQDAGSHSAILDGRALSSGVYIYQIEMDGFRSTKKMVLLR